jgi:hypothetical protein
MTHHCRHKKDNPNKRNADGGSGESVIHPSFMIQNMIYILEGNTSSGWNGTTNANYSPTPMMGWMAGARLPFPEDIGAALVLLLTLAFQLQVIGEEGHILRNIIAYEHQNGWQQ